MLYRLLITFLAMLFYMTGFADTAYPPLNQISLQLNAEQWAATQTANVVVSVDASLDKLGLGEAQQTVLQKLNSIAKANWQITRFDRSQDQSGLETVHIEAQTRLATNALAGLRDAAKNVSKPGQTYRIQSIEFTPSLAEIEAVRLALRASIYSRAKSELAELNKMYPDQHYFLHGIDFNPPTVTPTPIPLQKNMFAVTRVVTAEPLVINANVQMTANVVFASQPPKQ